MITFFVLWLLNSSPFEQPYLFNTYPLYEACDTARRELIQEGKQAVCKAARRSHEVK